MREAQIRVNAREFAEWRAYDEIEPWGEQRADLRNAIVASVVYNVNRGPKSRALSPSDFMPTFGRRVQAQADVAERLMAFAQSHSSRKTARVAPSH